MLNVRKEGNQTILFIRGDDVKKLYHQQSSTLSTDDNDQVYYSFFSEQLLPIGHKPLQRIDWSRRFDHMQQHSGQHLISAIALAEPFRMTTISWNLGTESSYIEFDCDVISENMLELLESEINEKIRECLPVSITFCDNENLVNFGVRSHGVPEGSNGIVRIITIEGIDKNTCCGTHVQNLAHLQVVKLVGTQKGKKGRTQLIFLVGGRILTTLGATLRRERELTTALKCPPEELAVMLGKTQRNVSRCKCVLILNSSNSPKQKKDQTA